MVSLTNSIGTTGCCCLVALLCPTLYDPWIAAHPTSLSLTISRNLPKFMFIALVMPPSRLILWCPPLLLPSIFPRTFPMSHLFTSNEQNTGASVSASVLPVNIQGLSPLKLTGLISLLSKGLSGIFSSIAVQRHQFFCVLLSLQSLVAQLVKNLPAVQET